MKSGSNPKTLHVTKLKLAPVELERLGRHVVQAIFVVCSVPPPNKGKRWQSKVPALACCVFDVACDGPMLSQDKMLLETVAHSVAMGAVMDQKQRWAAVMQVEPLRKVVAEALHQVSQNQPLTAALHRPFLCFSARKKESAPYGKIEREGVIFQSVHSKVI